LFRQATELAPLWVDAWNDLSLAYQKAGDWPSALTAANTALRLDSQSAAGQYNLGASYLGLGDPESALAYLDLAAKQQPKSVEVWLALARAREQAHLRVTAVMAYEQVLKLEPGNAEAAAGLKRVQALLPPT
jgi:predicted Zn-dependent protease